jgi:hypothetical protein
VIHIDTMWSGLWIAVTVTDHHEIVWRRGVTRQHAEARLIRALQ